MAEPTWEDVPRLVVQALRLPVPITGTNNEDDHDLKLGNRFALEKDAGPGPLALAIAGGLLGGGAGYLGGAALEHLVPQRLMNRGRLRRNLGLLGAGLGTVPGLWFGSALSRADAELDQPALGKSPHSSFTDKIAAIVTNVPKAHEFRKRAAALDTGALMAESVPVDAFNRAIWNDVRPQAARWNPYGTKSPWGDDKQPLGTPQDIAAVASGLVAGIAHQDQTSILSPGQIVRGLAGAGVGLVTANVAGRVLGALGSLTPEAQTQLQNMGIWAGLLGAIVPKVMGRG